MGTVCFRFLYLLNLLCQLMMHTNAAAYTLTPSQSIVDGQTLISEDGTFELGFFSPSTASKKRYVGIWYKTIPVTTVVWVANRNSPLFDTSGVVKISTTTGNLVIVNQTESVVWSSNSPKIVQFPVLEFLKTGNLVLRDADSHINLWQSFDYPSDTLIPGMKIGRNFKNGLHHFLTSWKSFDDPAFGDFTLQLSVLTTGDFMLEDSKYYCEPMVRNGPNTHVRIGLWSARKINGMPSVKDNSHFSMNIVGNEEEIYYTSGVINQSVLFRIVLFPDGQLQSSVWVATTSHWRRLLQFPKDVCDHYALCGAYGLCEANLAICQCLEKFKPRSPDHWDRADWSHGCEREVPLNCSNGEGFMKVTGVKLPDTTTGVSVARTNTNLKKCSEICLNNCSCMAYAASAQENGCIMWFADLVDIRVELSEAVSDLYIRMAESALDSTDYSNRKKTVIKITSVIFSIGALLLGLGSWVIWRRRSKVHMENDPIESPLYDLGIITNATNNFSEENKLGEGGFGPVYKGTLEGGEEIAVKRLSENSIQGINEFMNEVILISKLQHRNLVRLLGCCIQGEEKMLIYEYMPNKSLDLFVFDEKKRKLLDWKQRFSIILGIARGILYLHHDSRLRIIHRDLKASNILLDREIVPKISDFGMARLFAGAQTEARTTRVVGTFGYMSPEYAMDGKFSMKSDVFSFGVLVLEIISGKKNRSFSHPEHGHNLLGHAWKLWKEDKSMELVDEWISDSFFAEDVLRCIQIGLLCVQKTREERPSMPDVVLMLSSGTVILPKPKTPGYYIERSTSLTANKDIESCVSNEMSITLIGGR